MLFFGVILFLISFEALMWAWTLNRHGGWISRHPNMDRRKMVSTLMIKSTSCMSAFLTIFVWLWWAYLSSSRIHEIPNNEFIFHCVCTVLSYSVQITIIHFSAMIARYSCLPRSLWPMISILVSKILVKLFSIKEPALTSYDVHRCWEHLSKDFEHVKSNRKKSKTTGKSVRPKT